MIRSESLATPRASLVVLALSIALAPAATAHGGLFRGGAGGPVPLPPPPPSSGNPGGPPVTVAPRSEFAPVPGSPPSLQFNESRWEFWWEFNHDAWVNLRPIVGNAPGFVPFDAAGRAQVLLPALVELLRDKDEQVRSAAVFALARLDDVSTLPYLSNAAVGDPSLAVRTNAVIALGLTRNPKAVDRLKATFEDERTSEEVRAFAAVALGTCGAPDGSAVLRDALAGGAESRLSLPVRQAAIFALALTNDPGNAPFLRSLAQSRGLNDNTRALVIEALGRVADRAANPLLLEALVASATPVRRSAAMVLGVVAQPDDADVIRGLERAAGDDADAVVRSFAEISLGRIASQGAPQVVERLRGRLKSATTRQLPFVALALGISGYEVAAPDLLAQFKDEGNNSMRAALAVSLSLLGQKEVARDLRAAFKNEKDPYLRSHLAYALGRLGDVEVQKDLRAILADENDPQLLYWSAVGLGLLGDRSTPAYLIELFNTKKGLEQLTRASYVVAIGSIGDRESAPFLIEVAKNQGETDVVRAFATYALGMLCDEDRMPRTATLAANHNYTMGLTFLPEVYYLF